MRRILGIACIALLLAFAGCSSSSTSGGGPSTDMYKPAQDMSKYKQQQGMAGGAMGTPPGGAMGTPPGKPPG